MPFCFVSGSQEDVVRGETSMDYAPLTQHTSCSSDKGTTKLWSDRIKLQLSHARMAWAWAVTGWEDYSIGGVNEN